MNILDIGLAAGISGTADTYWHNEEQAAVNTMWDNSTQIVQAQEQSAIGSNVYNAIELQAVPAIEPNSGNYYKTGDGAMKLIFKDIGKQIGRGIYYQFDNSYWLTYYTHSQLTTQAFCYAIRCDFMIKYKNPNTYETIVSPSKLYDAMNLELEIRNKNIITPKGKIKILTQNNEVNKQYLKINRRLIVGSNVYKIIGVDDGHLDRDGAINLVYIELEIDEIRETDNFITGIADNDDVVVQPGTIMIEPPFDRIRVGQKINFRGRYGTWNVFAESLSPHLAIYEDVDGREIDENGNITYRWIAEGVLQTKTATIRLTANVPEGTITKDHTVRVTSSIG